MQNRIGRLLLVLGISIAVAAPLGACGKKGALEAPPAKEETKKKKAS